MENIVELDVRPILAGGVDPFEKIMETLKEMGDTQTLEIINTFEPVPLLNVLKGKGYDYKTERPDDGSIHTFLFKKQENTVERNETKETNAELSFEDLEKKYSGKLKEIDVRDLEMPMPMVTILEEIEKLSEGEALYVHHKRLPQYLLPELEDRNYNLVKKEIDEDNLKIIIFK